MPLTQWKYHNYLKVYIIISCSNPYSYGCRDMSGQYIIGQIKAGFELSADPSNCNQQKCYWVKKIKILPVCLSRSCKTIIPEQIAQFNYDLHVFDIVQPYQSDLIHLCEHSSPFPF